jgi:hypothetical protein
MANSIQFYGIDAVMKAAENRKCAAWSIWHNKQFLFKSLPDQDEGQALDYLKDILESVADNDVIYTIKFYEEVQGKINEKTPCDGSFNFKILDEEEMQERRYKRQAMGNRYNGLKEWQQNIEEKLDRLLGEGDEEEEEEKTLEGELIGMVNNPIKLIEFVQSLNQAKALLTGAEVTPGTIANVLRAGQIKEVPAPAPGQLEANLSHDEMMQRLNVALTTLGENDPNIIFHLEKLATLSTEKPETFKTAIAMLEGM